jgi:hypothetical protein
MDRAFPEFENLRLIRSADEDEFRVWRDVGEGQKTRAKGKKLLRLGRSISREYMLLFYIGE